MIEKLICYLLIPLSYLHYFFKYELYGSKIPSSLLTRRVTRFTRKINTTVYVVYDKFSYPGLLKKYNRGRVWKFKKIPIHYMFKKKYILKKFFNKIYNNVILFYIDDNRDNVSLGFVECVISHKRITISNCILTSEFIEKRGVYRDLDIENDRVTIIGYLL